MCGLVGLAGDLTGTRKDIFPELLLVDSVRGIHSTGAGFVDKHTSEFKLVKEPGNPFWLFRKKEFNDCMDNNNPSKVFIGHNRFATMGEHTEANAHPFAFEHVMGAHNGTLDKFSIKDLHNANQYGTDSEAIMSTINQMGIVDTAKKITGAWALVWFDKRDSTINFLRNDRRPLFYCYTKDRCTLIWASEAEMLRYVLARRKQEIHGDEIFSVVKDTQHKWYVDKSSFKKFDAPEKIQVEGKSFYNANIPFRDALTMGHSVKQITSISPSPSFFNRVNTRKFRPPYRDIYNHVINKNQFTDLVSNGCTFCGNNSIYWTQFIHLIGRWTGPDTTPFMCENCFNNKDIYDIIQYAV